MLLIHDQNLDAAAIAQLHGHIHSRLATSCREFGLREPEQLHAVRRELKTGRTGSRTPFQILADYCQTGDTRDRNLWHEYSHVTRSLAAVRWSRGLRANILGLPAEPERTDEQLAAEGVNGELLVAIQLAAWSRLRLAGLDLAVLVAAEYGGPAAVTALVLSAAWVGCRENNNCRTWP